MSACEYECVCVYCTLVSAAIIGAINQFTPAFLLHSHTCTLFFRQRVQMCSECFFLSIISRFSSFFNISLSTTLCAFFSMSFCHRFVLCVCFYAPTKKVGKPNVYFTLEEEEKNGTKIEERNVLKLKIGTHWRSHDMSIRRTVCMSGKFYTTKCDIAFNWGTPKDRNWFNVMDLLAISDTLSCLLAVIATTTTTMAVATAIVWSNLCVFKMHKCIHDAKSVWSCGRLTWVNVRVYFVINACIITTTTLPSQPSLFKSHNFFSVYLYSWITNRNL